MLHKMIFMVGAIIAATLSMQPASRAASPRLIEQTEFLPVQIGGRSYRLEIMIVKPADAVGRLPVALITHGRDGKAEGNARMRAGDGWALSLARDFAYRGWIAVSVIRRGFGQSNGTQATLVSCERPNFRETFEQSADDMAAALAAIAQWPGVDPNRVIAVGQSAGGATVMALAARQPKGLVAAINLSGGLKVSKNGSPCNYQPALIATFGSYGARTRVPTLWVYGENDSLFGGVARGLHRAYVAAGGQADFVMLPAYDQEGHNLCCTFEGKRRWLPQLDRFLMTHSLPTWNRTFLEANLRAARTIDTGQQVFQDYFAAPSEKALAISSSGRFLSWAVRPDASAARQSSLEECQKHSGETCELLLQDFSVVAPAALPAPNLVTTAAAPYRAVALAWNGNGAWVVRTVPSLEAARTEALALCNRDYGNCTLATLTIKPDSILCLAIARSNESRNKLYAATRNSLTDARAAALEQFRSTGSSGAIEYAACNA
jgi:dienelactone hydrolase